ncbi:hypothetical protein CRG98_030654 [Punica granatum]|uniref:Uncharacterized protein n=1 Tax=Punica granatum TaxID=22663 RepID=A0A2I0IZV3_PUNGR|nr:hypothetical protein CRG98_030654 [Punica granatum]
MTDIALVGSRCRCHCAEKRPIGEPRDPDALIPPLMKLLVDVLSRIPEFGGGPQEDPIHRDLGEHNHISDNALDESVIHRPESPPDAHDVLPWWRDCFEPETGSWAFHPYLDGGDAGLTS